MAAKRFVVAAQCFVLVALRAGAAMSSRWKADGWDDDRVDSGGEQVQRFRRKKERPTAHRKLSEMTGKAGEVKDKVILKLLEQGHITEVVAELKSGKEATTYLAHSVRGDALVKIYRDFSARSFKNDRIYREGKFQADPRIARAMKNRSRRGLDMLQADWVMSEYAHLWRLWNAGLSVPEPLVGPDKAAYAETVPAVLMRLIGTEDQPAPRLSDVQLTEDEAQSAWQQAVQGMANMLRLGYVHGDYSTYNILWWQGRAVIIDFPQLCTRENPNFDTLLERDAYSLSSSFRSHGIRISAKEVLREVKRLVEEGPLPEPRVTDV